MPCFTAMRAEIALMSGSAFAVTHHAFSSGAGRTSDGNGSHASTLKSPSYTKSVSWQHYHRHRCLLLANDDYHFHEPALAPVTGGYLCDFV
ncbi:putative IS1 encoded protein [Shigella dysenteriae 225-75]|uniref:IS1 encoded protein n=1 Tax=Shigella boydii serotype 4 (strain Sb227) TaxID=300268 RepID=Q31WN9_SHIBS|nr:putative IS1 encoded protein [Shigella boydii Sb227]EIQ57540.1 putative IS1 encoded protein [Shigella dysenteriae 225-75]